MRVLVSILMILGACFVVVIGLLSVVHDLLLRTTNHVSSEFDGEDMRDEGSTICHETPEHLR